MIFSASYLQDIDRSLINLWQIDYTLFFIFSAIQKALCGFSGATKIEEIINFAATNIPSAFNSQSARLVLLLAKENKKFWDLVKGALKAKVSEKAYESASQKIDACFACGYGTVLYFEDMQVVKYLQDNYPTYSAKFPDWSHHTSAMHQLAVWTMLEDVGFGASLQHYNPLIDDEVRKTWYLPDSWNLVAEMPFGLPTAEPAPKGEQQPLKDRVKIFK